MADMGWTERERDLERVYDSGNHYVTADDGRSIGPLPKRVIRSIDFAPKFAESVREILKGYMPSADTTGMHKARVLLAEWDALEESCNATPR